MRDALMSVWVLLAGLGTAMPALAQRFDDQGFWHPAWGWGHMFFGGLMMIIFWGGIIVLIILLARWLGSAGTPSQPAHGRPTPLEILQERYARGEIDKEEYQQRKRDLAE